MSKETFFKAIHYEMRIKCKKKRERELFFCLFVYNRLFVQQCECVDLNEVVIPRNIQLNRTRAGQGFANFTRKQKEHPYELTN